MPKDKETHVAKYRATRRVVSLVTRHRQHQGQAAFSTKLEPIEWQSTCFATQRQHVELWTQL